MSDATAFEGWARRTTRSKWKRYVCGVSEEVVLALLLERSDLIGWDKTIVAKGNDPNRRINPTRKLTF